MKAGIIAEGAGDAAVVTNILKGKLGLQRSDIIYLTPDLDFDETDLSLMRPEQFSTWSVVRQKCCDDLFLTRFFEGIDDNRILVVHIDAAERFEKNYEVLEPKRSEADDYPVEVRRNIEAKIREWTRGSYSNKIVCAIAVEETDAWLLTIYLPLQTETALLANPKERLNKELNKPNLLTDKERKKLFSQSIFNRYLQLSEPFRKLKELNKLSEKNASLLMFCEDLEKYKQ